MNIDEMLNAALGAICEVQPNTYTGDKTEYVTFAYNEYPRVFAGSTPGAMVYSISVHLYTQSGKNPRSLKKRIRNALAAIGTTYPDTINASDQDGQHYIFECEYTDGDV